MDTCSIEHAAGLPALTSAPAALLSCAPSGWWERSPGLRPPLHVKHKDLLQCCSCSIKLRVLSGWQGAVAPMGAQLLKLVWVTHPLRGPDLHACDRSYTHKTCANSALEACDAHGRLNDFCAYDTYDGAHDFEVDGKYRSC
eukprot:1157334-Pelagomonas_calceolata.AAC.20